MAKWHRGFDIDQSLAALWGLGCCGNETKEMRMARLMMLLFSIIGTSFMGAGVVVVLTMGRTTAMDIMVSAAIGFVLAIPASWLLAKKLS